MYTVGVYVTVFLKKVKYSDYSEICLLIMLTLYILHVLDILRMSESNKLFLINT